MRSAGPALVHVFALTCMLAPLPLGSNRPLSWSVLALVAGLFAFAASHRVGATPPARWVRHPLTLVLVALYVVPFGWMIFQAAGWMPAPWAHPMWAEMNRVLDLDLPARRSVDPAQTLDAAMRVASYGIVFLAAALFCTTEQRTATVVAYVAYGVALYAAYGIVLHGAGLERILWFEKWAYVGHLTSTFVNRNTMATFSGLGLLAGVALLIRRLRHAGQGDGARGTRRGVRLRDFLERDAGRLVAPSVGFLASATALLLTHSRAGLAAALAALSGFLLIAVAIGLVRRGPMAVLAVVSIGGLVYTFALSGGGVIDRFQVSALGGDERWVVYERSLAAIATAPGGGYGAGTFETAFKSFKTAPLSWATWDKAHSTPLETWLELGLYGGTMLNAVFLILLTGFVFGVATRRRDRVWPSLGVAATALVGIHATVDFSLQIPGFAVVFSLLAGALWPQIFRSHWQVEAGDASRQSRPRTG